MTTNLAAKMRRNARRLDKLNVRVTSVLAAMKRGEALLLEFRWYGCSWQLSHGRSVRDDVACIVIQNKNIVDVGAAFQIDGAGPQTYCWVGD